MARSFPLSALSLVLAIGACHPMSNVAAAPTPRRETRPVSLLADSAAAQKAALELERLNLLTRYEPWADRVRAVEDRILAIDLQLVLLPARDALAAIDGVLVSLDQREAGLRVEIEQTLTKYHIDAAPVRRLDNEIRHLLVRRIELQAQRSDYIIRQSSS